jgi:myo-inositol 2-dehydrogenase/D-chiro-inositol 1-dehydrogenase
VVDPALSFDHELVADQNFKWLNDIDLALSESAINGIIISTPTQYHFDYICRSLEAGKHVFTEKPLGKSSDDIKKCFDLAEKKKLALYLGFQRRYDHNFIELKKNIEKIGPIRTIKMSSRDNPKPSLEYLKISGNIFHDMLIHDFDMLQFLLGEKIPNAVFALGHAYDSNIKEMGDFDTVLVTLQYDDGLICSIDTSRTAPYGYDQRIELFAEKGMAIAENQKNTTVQVFTEIGQLQSPINFSFPQRYKDAYTKEIADFACGIHSGQLFNVSKRECMLGHLIADAAFESAVSNKVVAFQEKFANELLGIA